MLAFVENQIDDTVKIKNIYFATFPISILGTVVVIVKLDTNDMVFATIQNVDYYEDMDFRKVYAYQEMMQYLNTFSVTA